MQYTFECGAAAWLNEPAVSISHVVGGSTVGLVIDGHSDFYPYIDSDQKIGDPKALYKQVFQDLGMPASLLDGLSLDEEYAAYA